MVLRLKVPAKERDAAEKLARKRALGSLEEMLALLVADVAKAAERPSEMGRVWDWLDSHYEPSRLRQGKKENR